MNTLSFLKRLRDHDRGTATVELGLICAFIFLAIIAGAQGMADENSGMWSQVSTKTEAAISRNIP